MVEQVNSALHDFTATDSKLSYHGGDETDVVPTKSQANLQDYRPGSAAGAAAVQTVTVSTTQQRLVGMDMTLGERHCSNNSDGMTIPNISTGSSDIEDHGNQEEVLITSCGQRRLHGTDEQSSLSDQSNFMIELGKDKSMNLAPLMFSPELTPNQTLTWMKREWKKARDRAKKRSKRADPSYRTKERADALIRMRNRRSDPEYRERERARDRQRRKLARQKNLTQREEERARDRMYKQRRRTSLIQDPQLDSAIHTVSSQFINPEDTSQNVPDIESSRDTADLESTNDLEFQTVEVYKEMEVKVEQCVEAYS